jgi:hypothetical protein
MTKDFSNVHGVSNVSNDPQPAATARAQGDINVEDPL